MVREVAEYKYQSFFQWKEKGKSVKLLKNAMIFDMTFKELEIFFEKDRDIHRNENIQKAYDYGYSKTEIPHFVGLTSKSVMKVLNAK